MAILPLIRKIRRRKTKPKVGDYVFASRWRDCDPYDPWCVGYVEAITEDTYKSYLINFGKSSRNFRHAWCISDAEGLEIINLYTRAT